MEGGVTRGFVAGQKLNNSPGQRPCFLDLRILNDHCSMWSFLQGSLVVSGRCSDPPLGPSFPDSSKLAPAGQAEACSEGPGSCVKQQEAVGRGTVRRSADLRNGWTTEKGRCGEVTGSSGQ